MQHHFDIDHAKKYGVEEAIVINCFQFWITHNRANGKHLHEGRTWTFNSVKALSEIFDYWTPKQIRRIMDSLQQQNVLITGNYNKLNYDRTTWYAFENESLFLNRQPDLPKRANGLDQTGNPIGPNGPTIPVDNPVDNPVDKGEGETSFPDPPTIPTDPELVLETEHEKEKVARKRKSFSPPTLEEARAYFQEKESPSEWADQFWNYYEANGWRVGRNKMEKWRNAAAGWISRQKNYSNGKSSAGPGREKSPHLVTEETLRSVYAKLQADGLA